MGWLSEEPWLSEAEDAATDPTDVDAKFNYEIVSRINPLLERRVVKTNPGPRKP